MSVRRAMILAAGKGERMLPLTKSLPKPLLPIGGTTLIQRHLRRLADSGIERVVINVHYLGNLIVEALGQEYSEWSCCILKNQNYWKRREAFERRCRSWG